MFAVSFRYIQLYYALLLEGSFYFSTLSALKVFVSFLDNL